MVRWLDFVASLLPSAGVVVGGKPSTTDVGLMTLPAVGAKFTGADVGAPSEGRRKAPEVGSKLGDEGNPAADVATKDVWGDPGSTTYGEGNTLSALVACDPAVDAKFRGADVGAPSEG